MTPDPQALTQFLIVLGFLGSIVASLVAIRSSNRAQKREVSFADEFATRAQHDDLKGRVDKIADEIRSEFARLDQKRSVSIAGVHDDLENAIAALRAGVKQDVEGVHDRINVVLAAVSELKGRLSK